MLKVNVGFSKKVGEANYGSRGASLHLELELDSSLASSPRRLKTRVRRLFALAKTCVAEELAAAASPSASALVSSRVPTSPSARAELSRPATASQLRAIQAIAANKQLEILPWLQQTHEVTTLEELTLAQASRVIDELNAISHVTEPRA